jgi:hypothetical protein
MTDEIIKQEQPQKKFNWANLPIILAISIILIGIIISKLSLTFLADDFYLPEKVEFTVFGIFICLSIIPVLLCPVGLIFQIINKNKTIFDKVLLGINILFCLNILIMLLFSIIFDD